MLRLDTPSIEDIKNIPKDVTKLVIKNVLSIDVMKAINKLNRIDYLELMYLYIHINVATEISKSKTIKSINLYSIWFITIDTNNELLKSKSIVYYYNSNHYVYSLGINKSIMLKIKGGYIYKTDTSTVLNLIPSIKPMYTIKTNYNFINWHQKYEIL